MSSQTSAVFSPSPSIENKEWFENTFGMLKLPDARYLGGKAQFVRLSHVQLQL